MTALPETIAFSRGERNIFFHILTACNLACRHCYINPEQHGRGLVDLETAERWLRLFFAPARRNNLVILGGEPTLHPDLAAMVKAARAQGYASVTIDTNGYCCHDILERIAPDEAVLSFSLDGPDAAVNDPIRGAGSFAVCTANLRRAVDRGFAVSVITTVSRMNIGAVHRMPALLADAGVRRFFIQVIGLRGRAAAGGEEELQLTPDEWLTTVPDVARNAAALGLEVIWPKVFLAPQEPFECAGQVAENFFIFPNGRVYRCPLCEDYPVNALEVAQDQLQARAGLTEDRFFTLSIPEGCVMAKLLQPDNIPRDEAGRPLARISCVLLKQRLPGHRQ